MSRLAAIKEKIQICTSNPKNLITYLWILILLFAFIYSLSAIVMAANNDGNGPTDNKSLGFAAIWMMLLVIGLAVGGTMVMRKYQSPLAVGFFIGVVVMMAFNMFTMTVLFCGAAYDARRDPTGDGDVHSDEAAAVFSFFLFVLYAVFAAVIVKFRHVIIVNANNEPEDDSLPSKIKKMPTKMETISIPAPAHIASSSPVNSAAPPVSV